MIAHASRQLLQPRRTWSRTSRTPGHRADENGWNTIWTGPCTQTTSGGSIPAAVDFATFQGFRNYIEANSALRVGGVLGRRRQVRLVERHLRLWLHPEDHGGVDLHRGIDERRVPVRLVQAPTPPRCSSPTRPAGASSPGSFPVSNGDINVYGGAYDPDQQEQRHRHQVARDLGRAAAGAMEDGRARGRTRAAGRRAAAATARPAGLTGGGYSPGQAGVQPRCLAGPGAGQDRPAAVAGPPGRGAAPEHRSSRETDRCASRPSGQRARCTIRPATRGREWRRSVPARSHRAAGRRTGTARRVA